MERKSFNRRITVREIILLGIVLIALFLGLYFGLIYYPLINRSAEVDASLAQVQLQTDVAKAQKAQYDRMKAEIERIKQSGDTTVMPPYNNNQQQETLNSIFTQTLADADRYDISYGKQPQLTDGVRIREVSISFTYSGDGVYDKVLDVLTSLMTTGYRCAMTTLALNPSADGLKDATSLTVRCSITFYELDS